MGSMLPFFLQTSLSWVDSVWSNPTDSDFFLSGLIMKNPAIPDFDTALSEFLASVEQDSHAFSSTLAFIGQWFHFTPTAFRNGAVSNSVEQNQGSCRVLALALLLRLSADQMLKCFGEHYREVLATPGVDNHHNLRRLLAEGLVDIRFDQSPLRRKQEPLTAEALT